MPLKADSISGRKIQPVTTLILINLTLMILDFNSTLAYSAKLQYLVVIVSTIVALANLRLVEAGIEKISLAKMGITILFGWGIIGIYYGKIFQYNTNGSLPIILPLIIASLPAIKFNSEIDLQLDFKLISLFCTFLNIEVMATHIHVLGANANFLYSHEKAYIIILGVSSSLFTKERKYIAFSISSAFLAMVTYIAGTYILAGATAFLTLLIIRIILLINIRALLIPPVIWFMYFATFELPQITAQANGLYTAVGRTNNVAYREFLISQLKSQLQSSPIVGTGFTKPVLIDTGNSLLPLHNDYFTIAVSGGFLAIAIYLSSIFLLNGLVLRTLKNPAINSNSKKLLICFLCTFNSYLATSLVNPISMKAHNTSIFACLFLSIFSICKHIRSETRHLLA